MDTIILGQFSLLILSGNFLWKEKKKNEDFAVEPQCIIIVTEASVTQLGF